MKLRLDTKPQPGYAGRMRYVKYPVEAGDKLYLEEVPRGFLVKTDSGPEMLVLEHFYANTRVRMVGGDDVRLVGNDTEVTVLETRKELNRRIPLVGDVVRVLPPSKHRGKVAIVGRKTSTRATLITLGSRDTITVDRNLLEVETDKWVLTER